MGKPVAYHAPRGREDVPDQAARRLNFLLILPIECLRGNQTMKLQCCVCLRIKSPRLGTYGAKAAGVLPDASHTYCPTCLAQVRSELAGVRAARLSLMPAAP